MNTPNIAPLSKYSPRVSVPLGLIEKATPEDAGALFDRLFDAAERKFGDYPAFEVQTEEENLVVARPRSEDAPTRPSGRPSSET
jgi:hypothetical protein